MKNNLKKVSAVLLLFSFVISNSCKKPTENLKLIIDSEMTEATVSLQFVNAKTKAQVGANNSSQKVSIMIEGEDKALVIDNSGSTNFKTANGFITVGVPSGTSLSSNNPIKFHIVAHANGYLSTSIPIEIRQKGTQHIVVNMVEINNTPDGVAAVKNSNGYTNSNGEVSNSIILTTPTVNTNFEQTKASVIIPAGTILMDENMNPISGTITSTLVYFNNQDESSLMSFPGGFSARTQNMGNVVFKTGGFVAMEMKNQNGVEVKNFSTPIQMKVEIPAATTNIEGTTISSGMIMPIWSYNPEDGVWKHESDPTITYNNASGKYEVNFEMIHLSYWNLDWWGDNVCDIGATVTISSNISNDKYVYMKLKYPNGSYDGHIGYFNAKNGTTFNFINAFPNQPMIVEAYSGSSCGSSNLVSTLSISNLCSGNYTLNYIETNTNITPITINVKAKCANAPNQIINPSMTIYATDINCYDFIYVGEMVNGILTTSVLSQGATYQFYGMYGDQWLTAPETFTANGTSFTYDQTLPQSVCN